MSTLQINHSVTTFQLQTSTTKVTEAEVPCRKSTDLLLGMTARMPCERVKPD